MAAERDTGRARSSAGESKRSQRQAGGPRGNHGPIAGQANPTDRLPGTGYSRPEGVRRPGGRRLSGRSAQSGIPPALCVFLGFARFGCPGCPQTVQARQPPPFTPLYSIYIGSTPPHIVSFRSVMETVGEGLTGPTSYAIMIGNIRRQNEFSASLNVKRGGHVELSSDICVLLAGVAEFNRTDDSSCRRGRSAVFCLFSIQSWLWSI